MVYEEFNEQLEQVGLFWMPNKVVIKESLFLLFIFSEHEKCFVESFFLFRGLIDIACYRVFFVI